MIETTTIQKRYEGFLQTQSLWKNNTIYNLSQFEIKATSAKINANINEKLRLGKYIERFVSFQLEEEKAITILCENIQIKKNKITLGELDCIISQNNKPLHLEIIFKFYVYDDAVGESEIDHFIGPNRKDSLVKKLTKLKEKQLPLLYSSECETYLNSIHLSSKNIEQQVYFKAQLFVPYSNRNIILNKLNTHCIVGFYIKEKELYQFKGCKFYIPSKKDWLIIPNKNVDWFNYKDFLQESKPYLERQFSPLCWIKKPNGELEKFFLIWWE